MKIKVLIIGLILVGAASCTQKTCPTYANVDVQKVEKSEVKV